MTELNFNFTSALINNMAKLSSHYLNQDSVLKMLKISEQCGVSQHYRTVHLLIFRSSEKSVKFWRIFGVFGNVGYFLWQRFIVFR